MSVRRLCAAVRYEAGSTAMDDQYQGWTSSDVERGSTRAAGCAPLVGEVARKTLPGVGRADMSRASTTVQPVNVDVTAWGEGKMSDAKEV